MDWNLRKTLIFGIAFSMAALLDAMSPQWATDLFAHRQVVASETVLTEHSMICTMDESINECL
jgi:hypothetical protein